MDPELANQWGVKRLHDKLQSALSSGDFYVAYQFIYCIYFRVSKNFSLANYLYGGSTILIGKNKYELSIDVAQLVLATLENCPKIEDEIWMHKMCDLVAAIKPSVNERDTLVKRIVRWVTMRKNDDLKLKTHRRLAEIFLVEKNYPSARYHYLLSGDGELCAKLLIQFQAAQGYSEEVDIFIVQTVLQYLCMKNSRAAIRVFYCYTSEHPQIQKPRPPYSFPLLNFVWFLFKAIESKKLRIFKILCEQYEMTIKRDPSFADYLEQIAQLFFGVKTSLNADQTSTPQITSSEMFSNIFQSLLSDLSLNLTRPRPSTNTQSSSNANFNVPDID
uniref:Golgi to ER traffic protein 4 homolog n=1 Tax=Cuerna arida TaxID=1464854 RepID=A0A1B6F0X9_9HEMI